MNNLILFIRIRVRWLLAAILLTIAVLTLSSCSESVPERVGLDFDLVESLPKQTLTYDDVRPTLERRCVVCHGCYDAPCQLKLSSIEGVSRGANKLKVYDKKRFKWQQPTRLFIDAETVEEWRGMDFYSVLNENGGATPEENVENSVLYKMLRLKQLHPLPKVGMLPEDFDVGLDREQVCTTLDEFDEFAEKHPQWGMPFALPNLSDKEYKQLASWVAQGAHASPEVKLSQAAGKAIEEWEAFFNGKSNKERLVSRYIYEHLVLAHIHFDKAPNREFFRLVRSHTPPGKAIDEIDSVRPYDDPGGPFYYRFRPVTSSIVDKSHIVYELSGNRMHRYRELFLGDDYAVDEFPRYSQAEPIGFFMRTVRKIQNVFNINMPITPFDAFESIPLQSRYQFLLDEARFFINGFIKGPVCRGLGALSSIEDQFWVFFLKPESPSGSTRHDLDNAFLSANGERLHLPTELGDTNRLLAAWAKYWSNEQKYIQAKFTYYHESCKPGEEHEDGVEIVCAKGDQLKLPLDISTAIKQFVWDGVNSDGSVNRNATLTVFRNLDSASVNYGLLGDEPETAWIIDYSVFERLHYLLVAGYNPFGTLGHQANARLYMDFLRTEGEDTFLFFLPVAKRKELFDFWHGVDRSTTRKQSMDTSEWLQIESVDGYTSDKKDQQHELFNLLRRHVAAKAPDEADLNRCNGSGCYASGSDRAMWRLANLKHKHGEEISETMPLQYFPALSYVRVGGKQGDAYTVIYNKTYRQYEEDSFIKEVNKRDAEDMSGDTLTVVKGLIGAYPNFFFDVKSEEIEAFVTACENLASYKDYERLVARYGVRRTNSAFWEIADWFQDLHVREQPIESGILDLSRYEDR